MKRLFLWLPTLLGLAGCGSLVQDVSVGNIPTAKPRLVVQGYISPQDTAVAIFVDAPTSVLGLYTNNTTSRFPIDSALVDLSDGSRTVRLARRNAPVPPVKRSTDLYYGVSTREFPIVVGRTYTLTVSAKGYPSVSARCTVPGGDTPTQIQVDSTKQQQGQGTYVRYSARLTWRDPANGTSYYKINGRIRSDVQRTIGQGTSSRDSVYRDETPLYQRNNAATVISDQNRNGQEITSVPYESYTNFYYGPDGSGRVQRIEITMSLLTIDEPMYRFLESVERQRNQGDNPFAEPVLIPSNIQGGLGCFGAYDQAPLTVRVK